MIPFSIWRSGVIQIPEDNNTLTSVSSDWAHDHAADSTTHGLSSFITSKTELNAALADGDEIPLYDSSTTSQKKSLLSRFWTYIVGKLPTYSGTLGAAKVEVVGTTEQFRLAYVETSDL